MGDDFTDEEIDASFRQLQALGVKVFTSNQTRVGMGRRISVFAEKYNILPAYHPHAQVHDPNEIATTKSMETLLAMSPLSRINLDIGHFTAGNNDAVAFLKNDTRQIVTTSASWQSSNTQVATVSPSGVVTGVGAGEADIVVTLDGIDGTSSLTVSNELSPKTTFLGTVAGPPPRPHRSPGCRRNRRP